MLKRMLGFATSLIYGISTMNMISCYVENKWLQLMIEIVLLILLIATVIVIDGKKENENVY